MFTSIEFCNFKALVHTTLPLGRLTVLVGPNGSGKSTVLYALRLLRDPDSGRLQNLLSRGAPQNSSVQMIVRTDAAAVDDREWNLFWDQKGPRSPRLSNSPGRQVGEVFGKAFSQVRTFALDPDAIGKPSPINPTQELREDGGNLAGVLDAMRDDAPERFGELNDELQRWFPEYDSVVFERSQGQKSFALRLRNGAGSISATDLSHGTRIALAMLTLAYLPAPPQLVAFDEIEHSMHPRLLSDVHTALLRLSYPEQFDVGRDPVQVLVTTHSPYFIDLFKESPEQVVIASKTDSGVQFEPLTSRKEMDEILLGTASLGEVWYSGILGGVPENR